MLKKLGLLVLGLVAISIPMQAFSLPLMQESIYENWRFYNDAHTYQYASVMDFYRTMPDGRLGGVWIGQEWRDLSWAHTLPTGFSVPPYEVTRAKLWIDAAFVNTDGNQIEIEGNLEWDALNHCWLDNSIYDLTELEDEYWSNDGFLDVTVHAGEYSLRLDQAIFMMDYTDGSTYSAIPEPATIILLGIGLAGLAGGYISRKRRS